MSFIFRDRKDEEFSYGENPDFGEKMKKRIRYYLMYGNIVMSIHNTVIEAEQQKKFYTDNKVVRYPELFSVEEFYTNVFSNKNEV